MLYARPDSNSNNVQATKIATVDDKIHQIDESKNFSTIHLEIEELAKVQRIRSMASQ